MPKYLRKTSTGAIFNWTPILAKRPDMIECDMDGHAIRSDDENMPKNVIEMEILGGKFAVPVYLIPTIEKLMEAKGPEVEAELCTEMILNDNAHQVPNRLVPDVALLGEKMMEATGATKDLQDKNSKLTRENGKLKKDLASAQESIESLNREIVNLKSQE